MQEQLLVMMEGGGIPGPRDFIGFDPLDNVGFYGEVSSSEFITPAQLSTLAGVQIGTLHNPDVSWLKFWIDDKIIFLAKKPIRHSVSWDNLNALGIVFGTKIVSVNGRNYSVRLLRGCNEDRTLTTDGFNLPIVVNSEWTRLLGTVFNGIGLDPRDKTPVGEWPLYNVADLGMASTSIPGYYQLCQETMLNHPYKIVRGYPSLGYTGYSTSSDNGSRIGWRPVLELIQE